MLRFRTLSTDWHGLESPGLNLDDPLHACCHGSRLLGREPAFVLHGGGNTSVKTDYVDITGRRIDALYVKGSGWDLATIEPAGFTPLRRSRLAELLELDRLSDEDMARELAAAKLDPGAPQPSVESLLHAFLPYAAVQHSHADVIVAMTNTADGEANSRQAFGDDVVVVPYVMPGFELARMVRDLWPRNVPDGVIGMVLLNHGLFSFGRSTREALERHVHLIERAERWLAAHTPGPDAEQRTPWRFPALELEQTAELRLQVSKAAGRSMIVTTHREESVAAFFGRDDWDDVACRGPLTPDHVIRTKRLPQIGLDVTSYVEAYHDYYQRNAGPFETDLTMLDPAPRVVLDRTQGMVTVGRTVAESDIVADIYHHTMDVVATVEDRLGGYVALSDSELFDCEYWDLEQAKLRGQGSPPELAGQVAVVTGAASGIGRACARALLDRGAAVVGLDVDDAVIDSFDRADWLGVQADVVSETDLDRILVEAVSRFGGVDVAIAAAGVFLAGAPIAELGEVDWRRTQAVNVDSVALLFRRLHPLLARSPSGGRVVVIGSRNVLAPGKGAASYSVSKAALTQLARVAALEWAADGIRVNVIHPDAVFDTGLWSDEILHQRAASYGLTVGEYKRRNLLGIEVTSDTVAEMVLAACGPAFAATTGAQVPVDGGNDRVV